MPPSGLDAMQKKRDTRTRKDQILPPKRANPGAQGGSDDGAGVDTRFTAVPLPQLAHNPSNARASYSEDAIDEMASFAGRIRPASTGGRRVPVSVVDQPPRGR